MKWSSRQYLIAFNMVSGIGGRRLQAIERHFGTLEEGWHASKEDLVKVEGIGSKTAQSFCAMRPLLSPLEEEVWAKRREAQIITLYDDEYPGYLRRLAVPPPVVYVVGKLPEEPGIAVVGTRRPSKSGIAQARQFASHLVHQGHTVISGLARGIDYFAHDETIKLGGRTVAVLGSNIANLYPGEHRALAKKITENGALVTEFSSRCSTLPGNFPRRNRIIAGCSHGVLVVQAGQKSGSIRTADWALELGIDVWAIPGEISDPLREGTHNLIKQGAYLVTHPKELLENTSQEALVKSPCLEGLYKAGYHANEIAATLQKPIHEVLAQISLLQLTKD